MTSQQEWNDFAATYAQVQRESRLPIETDVTSYLQTLFPLAELTVADIAAGTGRYALPLSGVSPAVELIDWAPNMLKLADHWLKAHHRANYTLTVADWHTLPKRPRADLIFVSQLPTLTPDNLPTLQAFGRRALILNLQTQATSSLLAQMAHRLKMAIPVQPQYDPQRTRTITDYLTTNQIPFSTHEFHYTLTDQASVGELLPNFARPFSVNQANQLAGQITGTANANQMTTVNLDYRFRLLVIPHEH
ncbi:class I SAM-dependent methyltransferase [Lacticaseibacillus camelliae]|nr:class I SAM-dependent methyltransferase [Lacticaseibacillus camelliae]